MALAVSKRVITEKSREASGKEPAGSRQFERNRTISPLTQARVPIVPMENLGVQRISNHGITVFPFVKVSG